MHVIWRAICPQIFPMARVLCSSYLSNENNLMVAITTDNATKIEDILQNLHNPTAMLHTELLFRLRRIKHTRDIPTGRISYRFISL